MKELIDKLKAKSIPQNRYHSSTDISLKDLQALIEHIEKLESLQSKGKTKEEVFNKNALKTMLHFELAGFKRTYPTLLQAIYEAMEEYAQSHQTDSQGKTKEGVIKENITILQICFEEAPVDFLGTGSNSKAADKEQREWNQKWQTAVENIKQSLSESHANKDGWVSCADRLPEKHQEVLFFLKKTDENGLQHDTIVKDWTLSNGEGGVCLKDDRATHWMPLPPKPQTL